MAALQMYLVMVPGVHDHPDSPRAGVSCYATDKAQALACARDELGLRVLPAGSVAVPISAPTEVRRAKVAA